MKKLTKKLLMAFLMISAALFLSCEKEDVANQNIDNLNPHTQKINYDSFLKEIKSYKMENDEIARAAFFGTKTVASKVEGSNLTFEVVTHQITKINSADNLTTYTIGVKTNDNDSRPHYYKLILIVQGDNYDFKLLKFLPNIADVSLTDAIKSKFNGTIENIPFSGNALASKT